MKTKSLIAAVKKAGLKVEQVQNNRYLVTGTGQHDGGFTDQDGDAVVVWYKTKGEESDISIDYFVKTYVKSITRFIQEMQS